MYSGGICSPSPPQAFASKKFDLLLLASVLAKSSTFWSSTQNVHTNRVTGAPSLCVSLGAESSVCLRGIIFLACQGLTFFRRARHGDFHFLLAHFQSTIWFYFIILEVAVLSSLTQMSFRILFFVKVSTNCRRWSSQVKQKGNYQHCWDDTCLKKIPANRVIKAGFLQSVVVRVRVL